MAVSNAVSDPPQEQHIEEKKSTFFPALYGFMKDAYFVIFGLTMSIITLFLHPYVMIYRSLKGFFERSTEVIRIVSLLIQVLHLYLQVTVKFLNGLNKDDKPAETVINTIKNIGTATNNIYHRLLEGPNNPAFTHPQSSYPPRYEPLRPAAYPLAPAIDEFAGSGPQTIAQVPDYDAGEGSSGAAAGEQPLVNGHGNGQENGKTSGGHSVNKERRSSTEAAGNVEESAAADTKTGGNGGASRSHGQSPSKNANAGQSASAEYKPLDKDDKKNGNGGGGGRNGGVVNNEQKPSHAGAAARTGGQSADAKGKSPVKDIKTGGAGGASGQSSSDKSQPDLASQGEQRPASEVAGQRSGSSASSSNDSASFKTSEQDDGFDEVDQKAKAQNTSGSKAGTSPITPKGATTPAKQSPAPAK